jgi:hypothetical protein
MSSGFPRIEGTGPAKPGGGFRFWPEKSAGKYLRSGLFWLPAALIAGSGAWILLSGYATKPGQNEPLRLVTAIAAQPAPAPPVVAALSVPAFNPPTAAGEAIAPEETAPVDGLKISSQYWRRGGLGSNALVTFTLRNTNAYAVKDIAIFCAFSRRDGSHLTDRTRVIHDTVNLRSRKTFAHLHVGFVNVNASKAKCSLVGARHV